jgi:hypothetical protein
MMAKQTNIFTLKGNLGGVSFYKSKGVDLVRKASGPTKSAIMNHPRFERTRQNLSEFTGIARASASFASALSPVKKIAGGEFRTKLSRSLRTILKLSAEPRGRRPVMISQHREVLRNMDVGPETLSSLLAVNVHASHNEARNSGIIATLNFTPADKITLPPKATHFRLVHCLAVVSDTAFNSTTSQYDITDSLVHGLSDVKYSDYFDARSTADLQIVLDAALTGAPVLPDDVTVVQCVGIVFTELSGTTHYQLHSPTAMKIVDVF